MDWLLSGILTSNFICDTFFLGNGMTKEIQGWSIFLIGQPKITYEQIPEIDDSTENLTIDMNNHKRMYESANAGYSSEEENSINVGSRYNENLSKSQSIARQIKSKI